MRSGRYRSTFETEILGRTSEVEFTYDVAWGSPPTGQFGPPEDYDPGSPDEVENVEVEFIDQMDVQSEIFVADAARVEELRLVRKELDSLIEIDYFHQNLVDDALEAEEARRPE